MKNFLKKHITSIITLVYCSIFSLIYLNIAKFHEAWADEAQAWLLARDTNILELIKAMRYECSPCLWHLILKLAIFCGLSYEKIYYIPFICTIIGIIFLFRNKNVPWIFKLTIPFTYFIFFQYTVVSRSYCLIFPILMIIANIYDKKEEKLILYGILLFLLMNVSLHCTLIAGGLWAEFGYDIWKKYNIDKKIEKKEKVFLTTIFLLLLITIIMIFPSLDCSYNPGSSYNVLEIITETMYVSKDNLLINIVALIFIIIVLFKICDRQNYFKILLILLPVFLLNLLVTCGIWHIGILFLIILFLIMITKLFKNKTIFILFGVSIIIQMCWSICSSMYDIKYDYSGGKQISQYLKEVGYENKKIYAVGFHCVSVNAYFDENIFENYCKAFYTWKNEDAQKSSISYALENLNKNNYDIYIIPDYSSKLNKKLINEIEKLGYSNKYFEAYMVVKDSLYEKTGFYILEKMESIN